MSGSAVAAPRLTAHAKSWRKGFDMSHIPKEFDPEFIAERSSEADRIYHEQNTTKEPMAIGSLVVFCS